MTGAGDLAGARTNVVLALNAVDTRTLEAVAAETGISVRSLWRYRAGGGGTIPEARLRPLARALGIR